MRIYLAARFGRQAEMREVRDQLVVMGDTVTARWIDCAVAPNGVPHDLLNQTPARVAHFAVHDMEDLLAADVVISFTDGAGDEARGGRHVEFGLGLALGKRMLLVGEREHVFHALGRVEHWADWPTLAAEMGHWCRDLRDEGMHGADLGKIRSR